MEKRKRPRTTTTTSMEHASKRPCRPLYTRMVQNFVLVWLNENVDEDNNDDCRNTIAKLRQVINTVNTFTNVDKCLDYISNIKEEKVFMISSEVLGQTTVPLVHDKPQMSRIYIFCDNKDQHEKWTKQWPKIKGVFSDITPIYEALKQAVWECDQNSVSISFVTTNDDTSNKNLDQLDRSFYTQTLKEILLTIDFEQGHISEFLTYSREQFAGNTAQLSNIDKFEKITIIVIRFGGIPANISYIQCSTKHYVIWKST